MPDDNQPAESSVRLTVSPTVNYAVLITLAVGIGSGIWFAAQQTFALTALNNRVTDQTTALVERMAGGDKELNARMDRIMANLDPRIAAVEKKDDARSAAVAALDTRLARIEAQLDYMVKNLAQFQGGKR